MAFRHVTGALRHSHSLALCLCTATRISIFLGISTHLTLLHGDTDVADLAEEGDAIVLPTQESLRPPASDQLSISLAVPGLR